MSEKQKSSLVYWLFALFLIFLLGVSLFFNIGLGIALAISRHATSQVSDQAQDEYPSFTEEWSYGDGDVKAVRMVLSGIITRESETGWLERPVDKIENLIREIRAATQDDEVKAIILEIDSPGGGITPSDELYHQLQRFKTSAEGRKVVIFMRDLAASGGYYVAMSGDWILAQPTTVLGSIGVIMQSLNWKGLSERIGITDTTIKSGENKDLLNPFRESDPEQIALLQEMIDQMHARFRRLVGENRGIDETALADLADGRIFTSDQALDLRLIDQIGYWDEVVAKTAELLDVSSVKVVRYTTTETFWNLFLGVQHPLQRTFRSLSDTSPRLQYLWRP